MLVNIMVQVGPKSGCLSRGAKLWTHANLKSLDYEVHTQFSMKTLKGIKTAFLCLCGVKFNKPWLPNAPQATGLADCTIGGSIGGKIREYLFLADQCGLEYYQGMVDIFWPDTGLPHVLILGPSPILISGAVLTSIRSHLPGCYLRYSPSLTLT